jgi:prephenate dehydrogenase
VMDLQPGWFTLAWQILVAVCGLGGGIVGMWASLNFAKRKVVDDVAQKFALAQQAQDERLTRIEEQLRQAPKHSDLVALSVQVGELSNRIARMEGEASKTNNLLDAIHDYLLNQKK